MIIALKVVQDARLDVPVAPGPALSHAENPRLDADTERAAREFLRRLEGRYSVREAILYGSRARGTHTPESDADIAIVLEDADGNRSGALKDMAAIAFHVLMDTGVMVEAFPLWSGEFDRPETFSNPALIRNIVREGIRL